MVVLRARLILVLRESGGTLPGRFGNNFVSVD